MYVQVYIYIYTDMYKCISKTIHIHIYVYIWVCIERHIYIYIHIYTYTYIYIYLYIYIYIHHSLFFVGVHYDAVEQSWLFGRHGRWKGGRVGAIQVGAGGGCLGGPCSSTDGGG